MTPSGRAPRHGGSGPGPGLLLRIWVGCLGGSLAVAAALWLVVTRLPAAADVLGSEVVWVWLPAIAGGGLLIGVALAVWLSRGIARPLRGLARGIVSGQFADLRGLPSNSGWGEISELVQQVQMLLARQRQLSRSSAELDLLQQQIERMREPLERWSHTGRWESVEPEVGPLRAIALALQRGMSRAEARGGETRAAAEDVWTQRAGSLADARAAAEHAERAFVEATSLLTSVRELERLSGELRQTLGPASEETGSLRAAAEAYQRLRAAAAEAIEELVNASTTSVGHLADSMLRVAEISDQVHAIANRATLIALNAVAAVRAAERGAAPEADIGEEFKALARDVRAATDHTADLAREIEADVAAARERMQVVRARVAEVLARVPELPPAGGVVPSDEAGRLMERVREMVQDATTKGERLSAAGERASRSADALMRRLEEETRTLERLAGEPAGEAPASVPPARGPASAEGPGGAPPPRPFRLLGREDLEEDAGGREERR